ARNMKKATTPMAFMFEMPSFELPQFEFPKLEVQTAFRELAEKGVAQVKVSCEEAKNAAEDTTDLLEDAYAAAANGATAYNLKLIEAVRTNTSAAFDYARELLDV